MKAPLNLRVARFVASNHADVDFGTKNAYVVSAPTTVALLRATNELESAGFDVSVEETPLGWIAEITRLGCGLWVRA